MPTEFLLKDGNIIRRDVTETAISNQDQILSSLVEQRPLNIHHIASLGDSPIHMMTSQRANFVYTFLKYLPWDTKFKLTTATELSPNFDDEPGTTPFKENWPVPPMFRLIFGVMSEKINPEILDSSCTGTIPRGNRVRNCYMYLVHQNELYVLPYPNIFDDGRVCMGEEWDNNSGKLGDLIKALISSYNSFYSSKMTDHLLRNPIWDYFIYNIETGKWKFEDNKDPKAHLPHFRLASVASLQGLIVP